MITLPFVPTDLSFADPPSQPLGRPSRVSEDSSDANFANLLEALSLPPAVPLLVTEEVQMKTQLVTPEIISDERQTLQLEEDDDFETSNTVELSQPMVLFAPYIAEPLVPRDVIVSVDGESLPVVPQRDSQLVPLMSSLPRGTDRQASEPLVPRDVIVSVDGESLPVVPKRDNQLVPLMSSLPRGTDRQASEPLVPRDVIVSVDGESLPVVPKRDSQLVPLMSSLPRGTDRQTSEPLVPRDVIVSVDGESLPPNDEAAGYRGITPKFDSQAAAKSGLSLLGRPLWLMGNEGALANSTNLSDMSAYATTLLPWLDRAQSEGNPSLPQWAAVKLPQEKPGQWGEALRAALGERLQMQTSHRIDQALIRIDPPSLGSLEITIRHTAGVLSVQLRASHSDVVRQLHAISDALRQDLTMRQFTQVAVEVYEGMPGGDRQKQGRSGSEAQQPARSPSLALAEASDGNASPVDFTLNPG